MDNSAEMISGIFETHRQMLSSACDEAVCVSRLIENLSPHIEAHTAVVCPDCRQVCCINRHSRHDRSDMIYMAALGREIVPDSSGVGDSEPCRFLGSRGCMLVRAERPYRCNWFFCSPLLDHIVNSLNPQEYRKFHKMLKEITEKRISMISSFDTICKNISSVAQKG